MRNLFLCLMAIGATSAGAQSKDNGDPRDYFRNGYRQAIKYCIDRTPTYAWEAKCSQAVKAKGAYYNPVVLKMCDKTTNWGTMVECLEAGAGITITTAARVCDKSTNWDIMNRCLAAIGHMYYTPEEITNCDRFSQWEPTIACFASAGIPYRR